MVQIQIYIVVLFTTLIASQNPVYAQCAPIAVDHCVEAEVLCSILEMNNYSCQNKSKIPGECLPDGIGENTDWWAFQSKGGLTSIVLKVGSCQQKRGLEFGIMDACPCGTTIRSQFNPCVIPQSETTIEMQLNPCIIYYIWVDGSYGDICDFTINTKSTLPQNPETIGYINNINNQDSIVLCSNFCDYTFYIPPVKNTCNYKYTWSFDGSELPWNSNIIKMDLPGEGDFKLCVTGSESKPFSNTMCYQSGPRCLNLMIRDPQNFPGPLLPICYEAQSGSLCCKTNRIIVLDAPEPAEIYYLSCDHTPYMDPLGRAWSGCRDGFTIPLPKSTSIYHCDSSILLNAAQIDFATNNWNINCDKGIIELEPLWNNKNICSIGEVYEFDYNWYLKEKNPIDNLSNEQRYYTTKSGTYCCKLMVKTSLVNVTAFCEFTSCYTLNMDTIWNSRRLIGKDYLCLNEISRYNLIFDAAFPIDEYLWDVDGGGSFQEPNPSKFDSISISWNSTGRKTLCSRYKSGTYISCNYCKEIIINQTAYAGEDQQVFGLKTILHAKSSVQGIWRVLSGPGNSKLSNPSDPNSILSVSRKGKYRIAWETTKGPCLSKDTVDINFYTIPKSTNPLIKNRSKVEPNSIEINPFLNSTFYYTIQNPIPAKQDKITIQIINFFESNNIIYTWYDSNGMIITQGPIKYLNDQIAYEINLPNKTGIYLLKLATRSRISIQKIILL